MEDTSVPLDAPLSASARHGSWLHLFNGGRRDRRRQHHHPPELYEREWVLVTRAKFLKVYGKLQKQDGVIHVNAEALELLQVTAIEVRSHDFH
jgi:hypothetical protein